MNIKNIYVLFIGLFLWVGCSEDHVAPEIDPKNEINDFVWKGLNSWYYWQPRVPTLQDDAFANQAAYERYIGSMSPDQLFYSLLYKYKDVDRYSWIVDDVNKLLERFGGIDETTGMDISLMQLSDSNNVIGVINYIVPNSPADIAGLKRGFVLLKVNGKPLDLNNYKALFSNRFSLTYVEKLSLQDNQLKIEGEEKSVNLQTVVLEENPIALTKVYESNGKKIGYLVYNGFRLNYNGKLNKAFLELQNAGVTDLILDLRYNGGGSLGTAVALGQMITGNKTHSPYIYMDFNDKHNASDKEIVLSDKVKLYDFVNGTNKEVGEEDIHSLGLERVYVLTSRGTASASELTIVGLEPYIDVITIGGRTYGKFVGSTTLFDDPQSDYQVFQNRNKNHKWAMQPIVFSYTNAYKTDYSGYSGLEPTHYINPIEYYLGMKELGDISADPALAKAYELITGTSKHTDIPIKIKAEPLGTTATFTPFGTELYIEGELK